MSRLASRHEGRVKRGQLTQLGIGKGQIENWVRRGFLIPRLPGVFAVGYVSTSIESRLWESVLYAGPDAMLSHLTAAQWCGYIKFAPATIHVSTPRKITALPSLAVHGRRELVRCFHNGIPVTSPAQTVLDLATVRPDLLSRALSQLDYQGHLNPDAMDALMGNGLAGSKALRRALATYDPNYARLNDEFEFSFYEHCIAWGIDPLPIPNVEVAPHVTVDALWPDHRLVVECDGAKNHGSAAQKLRDADRDLICRSLGLTIIRYRHAQLTRSPEAVRADLNAQLGRHLPAG